MDCLLYVDPSPRGEWALTAAEALAPFGLSITLLATEEDARAHAGLVERARVRLGTAAVREALRPGPAERAVAAEAARGYGLLIVPPAGRNAVQRMIKGSRVAAVVRAVRAPVLVARRPPARLGRILAAVAGAGASAVARAAAELARATGARAEYLHVSSEVALPDAPAPDASGAPDAVDEARRAVRSAAAEASLTVREGLVVDEVLEAFEAGAHHLLVLGASPRERAWGEEDVTERLLLRCPGSTLIVPPEGFAL